MWSIFKSQRLFDRMIGLFFILAGVVAVVESFRLRPLRMRGAVGDDTMPLLIGIALIILGGLQAILSRQEKIVSYPPTGLLIRMMLSILVLFLYVALLGPLGYLLSTFLSSIVLFRLFGVYRWWICMSAAAAISIPLWGIFVRILHMPLSTGFLGL
jgi:putative tricarboxylic transport membrane protein